MGKRQKKICRERHTSALQFETNGKTTDASDSNSIRQHECNSDNEINTSKGRLNALNDSDTNVGQRDVADSKHEGRKRLHETRKENIKNWKSSKLWRNITRYNKKNNWENFPTQSPICGGDDGLPTELDGITFSKWRQESIKGYGNAIVPQIAYQIFKVIQQMENERVRDTIQDDPLP
jgi:hypothetical protein